ncbi:SLC13 family permease [Lichenifustis flavocetrariae]|uniref:SLC13 family permease n=1 Tax=Lichenifustis flavocetrariae TaxID=2949735 RepID=A0AA42CHX9_9HYPH|nr:SLC13 family permease [Lichenifustis flavocetrariae]MCW6507759.1 SLC13 family permease [Lichenifustis flavocetrariae]
MTLDQCLAFGLLATTIGLFIWGRLPYDLVAMLALLVGVVIGVVPEKHAFEGFSDEIVVIIAAALVVSACIARSGVVEAIMRPVLPRLRTAAIQVPVLSGCVLLLSMVTKNVGALAIFMPIALQLARRHKVSPSSLLMPMAAASLVGGVVTLVGTSPNIIIAKVRADMFGQPFGMFDYTPVGLTIALCSIAFLAVGWRLLPKRQAATSMDAAFTIERYTAEVILPSGSPAVGRPVAFLEAMQEGDVAVVGIVRERFRRYAPTPQSILKADDVLLLKGEPESLDGLIAHAGLRLATHDAKQGEATIVEGVVTDHSLLLGRTPDQVQLQARYGLGIVALSRRGQAIVQRLSTVRFRVGDVVVMRSLSATLPESLGELRILPLAERALSLGLSRRSWLPIGVLAVAMALVAFHLVGVAVAFFGAAVVLLLLRTMTMHEAYRTVEWHILFLLGALIPLSHAVRETGGTDLLARSLETVIHGMSPNLTIGVIMVIAMAVTPFFHNAPTVLVMGPIAGTLATKLGLNPDPFLMAVALGAGCDFLTPIGHQCNTLVMGPGGYRFGDYARLGFPLSILVVVAGTPLIAYFWPLTR